jgi:predicted phage terminase large subunit-like protein
VSKITAEVVARLYNDGHSAAAIVNAIYKQTRITVSVVDVQSLIDAIERQRALIENRPPPLPPAPLMDFIPEISPKFMRPRHLAPIVEKFEQIGSKPLRLVVHAPPRHGKTELVLATIAHGLRKDPSGVYGYSSYGMDLTLSKSIRCREMASRAGVRFKREAAKEWRTTDDGGLLATSIGGPLTGHGITRALFIDDAYKNRAQAESKKLRNMIWDWFSDVSVTRLESLASIIIFMVRWNQDDLAGRLLREKGRHKRGANGERLCPLDCPGCGPNPIDGFEEISLPAIDANGEALWPEVRSLEFLQGVRRMVTAYTWDSQYQGNPRARGTNVFEGIFYYDPKQMPSGGFSLSIGVDLSYTESTSADWAVAVVLMRWGLQYWILEVLRDQTTAPKFAQKLKAMRKRYRRAPMYSIFYGPEKGSIDFMRTLGVPIKGLPRSGDKFVRSQGTAAAWCDGRILIPMVVSTAEGVMIEIAEWVDPFIEVVSAFTGVKDDCDDDVDALVAAYEGAGQSPEAMLGTVQALHQTPIITVPGDDIGRSVSPRRSSSVPADTDGWGFDPKI